VYWSTNNEAYPKQKIQHMAHMLRTLSFTWWFPTNAFSAGMTVQAWCITPSWDSNSSLVQEGHFFT